LFELADAEYLSFRVKVTKNIANMNQILKSLLCHCVLNEILAPVGLKIETIPEMRTVTREH